MIAVGIPTLNEADNIDLLVRSIDNIALSLGEELLIINCDNSSQDGTADIFRSVPTANKKISLKTTQKGKGRNVRRIIQYVVNNDVEYCFFVDGDIVSMEPEWLSKHLYQAKNGSDYVVPNYARNMQEGNATNHFLFPVLNYFSDGRSPHQPISGDVGVSLKLAKHLARLPWSRAALGYGVDIFITMQALFGGFKVTEIDLGSKIHKPSFGKMINIFEDTATSYFEVRNKIDSYVSVDFNGNQNQEFTLLKGKPIPAEDVRQRAKVAKQLLATAGMTDQSKNYHIGKLGIDSPTWATALVDHELRIGTENASNLAKSLTPFYLLRVTQYLSEAKTPATAQEMLKLQTSLIAKRYAEASL